MTPISKMVVNPPIRARVNPNSNRGRGKSVPLEGLYPMKITKNTCKRPGKADELDAWVVEHPEFIDMAHRLDGLQTKELRTGLAFGALADRYIKRYDRVLNAAKLGQFMTEVTGRTYSRSKINDYCSAYRMYRLWRQECGGRPPHLEITKLARAWGANKGAFNDDDKVKLCQRTAEKGLTRTQMTDKVHRISTEKTRTELTYDITPTIRHVKCIDSVELLRECDPESVDVVLLSSGRQKQPVMGR